jgi:hypothetical protein
MEYCPCPLLVLGPKAPIDPPRPSMPGGASPELIMVSTYCTSDSQRYLATRRVCTALTPECLTFTTNFACVPATRSPLHRTCCVLTPPTGNANKRPQSSISSSTGRSMPDLWTMLARRVNTQSTTACHADLIPKGEAFLRQGCSAAQTTPPARLWSVRCINHNLPHACQAVLTSQLHFTLGSLACGVSLSLCSVPPWGIDA